MKEKSIGKKKSIGKSGENSIDVKNIKSFKFFYKSQICRILGF